MRTLMNLTISAAMLTVSNGIVTTATAAELPTKASDTFSIANTRHNLTQMFTPVAPTTPANINGISAIMDVGRNNYGEVCVYCHTPHGSNTQMGAAPLWNRTKPTGTFTVYGDGQTGTGQTVTQPGSPSLTCLSCHDGVTAIDSIINMPGSGGYNASQMTSVDKQWLQDAWVGKGGAGPTDASRHMSLGDCAGSCHAKAIPPIQQFIPDFTVFVMGLDLRDDHPVGVQRPDDSVNYNTPTVAGNLAFFDKNGNGRTESNEIRFYNTGQGFEVECASCHDPHGVPTAGTGSKFISSFLRVNNSAQSAVCLTCHIK